MKPNLLRTPLINSAILLGGVSLVVYFTLTSPGGTVWSSFGAIFCLAIRTIQLLIGLALSFLVCIAVLIGIFLGATAMSDPASASRIYERLREKIVNWLAPLAGLFKCDHKDKLQANLNEIEGNLKTDMNKLVSSAKQELTAAQAKLADKIQALHGQFQAVEDTATAKASVEQLEEVTAEITALTETLSSTDGNVKALQDKVEQTIKQTPEVDVDKILGDVPARLETLEQQKVPAPVDIKPLENTIIALQTEVDALKSALEEIRSNAQVEVAETAEVEVEEKTSEESEHRLLAYFDNEADKEKMTALVAETMKKDMTYAQVTNFLIKEMGKQGTVISEHPSLAKDYIRQCRRNA